MLRTPAVSRGSLLARVPRSARLLTAAQFSTAAVASNSISTSAGFPRFLPSPTSFACRPQQRLLATFAKEDSFNIPVIDFFALVDPAAAPAQIDETSRKVAEAFKTSGFIYLKNHGIPQEQLKMTFDKSAEFFKLPIDIKDRLAWKDPRANRGYVSEGRERVTQATSAEEIAALREKNPDYKESMEIGNEFDPIHKNEWPEESEVPEFRATMLAFRKAADQLHLKVLKSIAIGLGLDAEYFEDKCNQEWHTLRLLHYPSVHVDKLKVEGSARAGEHSDYGSITLLFQDMVGGLEVQNPHTKEWIPAPPIEGTIVVNVGDLLSRWSNDELRSTVHRVKAPRTLKPTDTMTPARYSIAFFCNPNEHQLIETLPTAKGPSKYESVLAGDYLEKRLSETYA
ncbi:hypothetical protein BJ742DRAFT_682418 [Cladochytrium replicatum]|nr:hypothetical protein BJ742DRAFT_682418 [Cladochytrium replicatum]